MLALALVHTSFIRIRMYRKLTTNDYASTYNFINNCTSQSTVIAFPPNKLLNQTYINISLHFMHFVESISAQWTLDSGRLFDDDDNTDASIR